MKADERERLKALSVELLEAFEDFCSDEWIGPSIKTAENQTTIGADEIPEYQDDCERLTRKWKRLSAAIAKVKEASQ